MCFGSGRPQCAERPNFIFIPFFFFYFIFIFARSAPRIFFLLRADAPRIYSLVSLGPLGLALGLVGERRSRGARIPLDPCKIVSNSNWFRGRCHRNQPMEYARSGNSIGFSKILFFYADVWLRRADNRSDVKSAWEGASRATEVPRRRNLTSGCLRSARSEGGFSKPTKKNTILKQALQAKPCWEGVWFIRLTFMDLKYFKNCCTIWAFCIETFFWKLKYDKLTFFLFKHVSGKTECSS